MSRYRITHDARGERWVVYRTDEHARFVGHFDTLHDAEQYVIEQGDES